MSDDKSPGEKEFEATDRKLEKARLRGEVVRSQEATALFGLVLFTSMVLVFGRFIADPLIELVRTLYSLEALISFQNGVTIAPTVGFAIAEAVLPILGALCFVGVFVGLAEMGFTIPSGEDAGFKIDPNKLNPVTNFKEKYGIKAALDSIKNVLKLVLISSILIYSAFDILQHAEGFLGLSPLALCHALSENIGLALARVCVAAVIIVVVDYSFEKIQFMRKQRMDQKELRDEMKESEGDPQFKAARKRKAQELAGDRAMASVETATVLVANPTHFSVTLRYNRGEDFAPVVLGKGRDRIALAMRKKARELAVPVVENKPLARALYAVAKEGQPIPTDFFKAVAEVIAYVMAPAGSGVLPPSPAEIPESAREAVAKLGGSV
ncbi:MAG: EscU/YscU/HrcU family type III secretion system export apparatus switch protein [Myxococcota bacterium]|nr:EscU/YscU/HrcU family type III secretion system export apparatus switch protein [Myxococcota bacterium]